MLSTRQYATIACMLGGVRSISCWHTVFTLNPHARASFG